MAGARGRLDVKVVSPEAVVFEGEATSVVAPAWDGKIGILPGHAPLLALLGEGALVVKGPGGKDARRVYVRRGVVQVEGDRVTVLSEAASRDVPEGAEEASLWLDLDEEPAQGEPAAPPNPAAS